MNSEEARKIIADCLTHKYGEISHIQKHDPPEWFGDGWMVSFETPAPAAGEMPVIRVAFFRNEMGKPTLAKEMVVRNSDGKYPPWRSIARALDPD